MLSVATESRDRFNCEYLEQQNTLDNIQSELRKQVELLDLESNDKADALSYIQDRGRVLALLLRLIIKMNLYF
jgi:hypothetical protein